MKRGTRFLVGFAAAALTLGSLMNFVGPKHFNRHGHCCEYNNESHCRDGKHQGFWDSKTESNADAAKEKPAEVNKDSSNI